MIRVFTALLLLCVLSACTWMGPVFDGELSSERVSESFILEARFSVREAGKNDSGRLRWAHTIADDRLLIASPLGQGVAKIKRDANTAALWLHDGRTFSAPTAKDLTYKVLGYALPIEELSDWVRGKVGVGRITSDELGRVASLHYEDWEILYTYPDARQHALPTRIFAKRGADFEIRMVVETWHEFSEELAPQ